MDMGGLFLAYDLMDPVLITISSSASASEARELLRRYNIDYLPVVSEDNRLEGFIERKKFNRFLSTKIIQLQKQADSLGYEPPDISDHAAPPSSAAALGP